MRSVTLFFLFSAQDAGEFRERNLKEEKRGFNGCRTVVIAGAAKLAKSDASKSRGRLEKGRRKRRKKKKKREAKTLLYFI